MVVAQAHVLGAKEVCVGALDALEDAENRSLDMLVHPVNEFDQGRNLVGLDFGSVVDGTLLHLQLAQEGLRAAFQIRQLLVQVHARRMRQRSFLRFQTCRDLRHCGLELLRVRREGLEALHLSAQLGDKVERLVQLCELWAALFQTRACSTLFVSKSTLAAQHGPPLDLLDALLLLLNGGLELSHFGGLALILTLELGDVIFDFADHSLNMRLEPTEV
mmetsp:Transcript_35182/g.80250  ORF Transcript_35182/g.80250 Transcript_35182/m.80250 type:complete len:218 (+) Transcript_35182:5086-5739(+)